LLQPTSLDCVQVLEQVRQELKAEPDGNEWTSWGRWFLADRSVRTISPFSRITAAEHLKNLMESLSPVSIPEAESMAFEDTNLLQRISLARSVFQARHLLWEDKLIEAETAAREVLAIEKKLQGNEHRDVANLPSCFGSVLGDLVKALKQQGNYAKAESLCGEAAESSSAWPLNGLAWELATSSDSRVRDGRRAVALAEKAAVMTNRKDPAILDTLAAAFAEVGDFLKAISVQKEALALLPSEKGKKDYTSRLKLYEGNRPYRDTE